MENFKTKTIIKEYSREAIEEASELLKEGKLVAFPTETVYGLGANAFDAEACTKIFSTKERPLTDPLIVHVYSLEQALTLLDTSSKEIVELFKILADRYWPGPLTMVVKANLELIPSLLTADTGFVGLRMPNHEVALDLLRTSKLPIAAPSANKFGHVSPTKAEHVFYDFHKDSEVYIIDGGSCSFGIESTVLKISHSLSNEKPFSLKILRRGGISESNLVQTFKDLELSDKILLESV